MNGSEYLKNLGKNIKARRRILHMSQDELAEELGYTNRQAVIKLEAGETDVPQTKLLAIAEALDTTADALTSVSAQGMDDTLFFTELSDTVVIPVFSRIAGGDPITTSDDVVDTITVNRKLTAGAECLAVRVEGHSMEPRIMDGDTVVIRCQPDVESGEIAAVFVREDEATLKRVRKDRYGLELVPLNPDYHPMRFTWDEVESLPVTIIGKCVEVRGKI